MRFLEKIKLASFPQKQTYHRKRWKSKEAYWIRILVNYFNIKKVL